MTKQNICIVFGGKSEAKTSVYAKLWEASGLSYSQLIEKLISLALVQPDYDQQD